MNIVQQNDPRVYGMPMLALQPFHDHALTLSGHPMQDLDYILILRTIQESKRTTLQQLQISTGLEDEDLANAVSRLKRSGLVMESRRIVNPRWKKPTELSLNRSMNLVAVDISDEKTSFALMDLEGAMIQLATGPAGKSAGSIIAGIDQFIQTKMQQDGNLVLGGIGICRQQGNGRHAWKDAASSPEQGLESSLRKHLTDTHHVRVCFPDKTAVGLLSHLWHDREAAAMNIGHITIGSSICVSVVADGMHYKAVHAPASGADDAGSAEKPCVMPCSCKQPSCSVLRIAGDEGSESYTSPFGEDSEFMLNVLGGSADEIKRVEQQAKSLCEYLSELTSAFRLNTVHIDGDVSPYWHIVQPYVEHYAKQHNVWSGRIVCAGDGGFERLRGTAAAIQQSLLGDRSI